LIKDRSIDDYELGSSDAEHERLIRQAAYLAPVTERLFREAGIGPGQRVLDFGSGVGDVAMLAAQLVGPSGEVVGVERDSHSIKRVRARVTEAGLHKVSFTECDISEVRSSKPFDAAVGRFILQWVPDPAAILRCLSQLVRPGGVLAFHEVSDTAFLALCARVPLWSATASLVHEIMRRPGRIQR
jgi:ubiquinone/menaquinone biosynthesis C-methylase UbiE